MMSYNFLMFWDGQYKLRKERGLVLLSTHLVTPMNIPELISNCGPIKLFFLNAHHNYIWLYFSLLFCKIRYYKIDYFSQINIGWRTLLKSTISIYSIFTSLMMALCWVNIVIIIIIFKKTNKSEGYGSGCKDQIMTKFRKENAWIELTKYNLFADL